MKEIGGYIELDTYQGTMYHENAIALNCGSSCLAYLIEARKIKKLYIPYFCCSSISEIATKYKVELEYYSINEHFRPEFDILLGANEWLYIINYYGQITNAEIERWKIQYKNIIIDNVQSYFQKPVSDVDTLYSCRKFFGVCDGAFLYTKSNIGRELKRDESFRRMEHVLGRFEHNASEFYEQFVMNEDFFDTQPILRMSKLTHNLLHAINYENVKKQRYENFMFLHKKFEAINHLELITPDGAFMYPLFVERGIEIRKLLQDKKIYVPMLWPDVFEVCKENDLEYMLAQNVLPLPVDQRYSLQDMEYMVLEVLKCIE